MARMSSVPSRGDLRRMAGWQHFAVWLTLAVGCNSNGLKTAGKDAGNSGGTIGGGGQAGTVDLGGGGAPVLTGTGGLAGTGGPVGSRGGGSGSGGVVSTGGAIQTGGTGLGGHASTGGIIGATGGSAGTGGGPGTGGRLGSGGRSGTGGGAGGAVGGGTGTIPPGSGGEAGLDAAAGSGGSLGMSCSTTQDCPASSVCCSGSDSTCDGTRLPAGDGTNPGEFEISPDGLTVTDTITGLVWQRDGSGLRPGCSASDDSRCTWAGAQSYCASLHLGGLSDWRLPGWMELLTILDLTTDWSSTAINQATFPDTAGDGYWTASPFGRLSVPLFVAFRSATVSLDCGGLGRVRCVRGARCYPTKRFAVLEGGLVRDTLTGLVWQQQGSSTMMSWADAQSYCSSLGTPGAGFRLPTLKELDSLVDPTLPAGPSLDSTAFSGTGTSRYWTSSPLGPGGAPSRDAFFGDFSSIDSNSCDVGAKNTAMIDTKLMVRCVR